jgi:hypothetical protein
VILKVTVSVVETPMYRGQISSNTDLLTDQNLSLDVGIEVEINVERGGERGGVRERSGE